jgi:predicted nuclease with TOPRIM domain
MNKFTVELEWDAVDSIVVQVLKNQYNGLKEELDRRTNDKETLGIFLSDKVADVAEIQKHLDSIKTVLSYNMIHEDFEEWKNGF